MDQIKKYEFRKVLDELRDKSGRGTELVSVYIPPDKQISDVTAQLRDEHGQAMNIKKMQKMNSACSRMRWASLLKYGEKNISYNRGSIPIKIVIGAILLPDPIDQIQDDRNRLRVGGLSCKAK